MSELLESATGLHMIAGVERLLERRALHVDQNEIWLGLEPIECRTLLEHFQRASTRERLPELYVLSSADPGALERRNRVAGPKPTLLVILDERWEARSHGVRQSLDDLSRKLPSDLLRELVEFPLEAQWLGMATGGEQREWIRALFDVLRGMNRKSSVRDRDGQTMRLRLSTYFGYLVNTLPEAQQSPDEALARGIHRLGLFTHPALATELRPKKGATEASRQQLRERIATSLSQNFRAARDAEDFAAQLSSSQRTAEKVLEDYLRKGGRLSSKEQGEEAASEAFRAFLRQQNVDEALRCVDWEFYEAAAAGDVKTRRGGRKRRFGVRGVLADRDSLAEKRQRIVEAFVQQASAEQQEQMRKDVDRLADELGRGATADAALQELRNRALGLWKEAGDNKALDLVLGWLDTIHRRAKRRDAVDIEADSLVAGLIEFGVWVRKISDGQPPKDWTITYPQKTTHSIEPMSEEWRCNTHKLLRAAAQTCVDDEALELDDGEEAPDTVPVALDVMAGKLGRQIVLRAPRDWTQDTFRSRVGQPRQVFVAHAAEPTRLQDVRTPVGLPAALHEIAEQISELAHELDPCGPYAIQMVRDVVTRYGELLQSASAGEAAERAHRRAELQARLKQLQKGDPERSQVLEEINELSEPAESEPAGSLNDLELRAFACLQTLLPDFVDKPGDASAGPKRGWLMPLHPLCLRARAVADEVGLEVLSALMTPQRQLSELQLSLLPDALEELDVLEPCRFLSPWSQGHSWPPLVFQEYEQHFAAFAPPQASQASYGRDALVRVLRNYTDLYPTAQDRLVLYLEADEDGRLAYDLSTALAFASEDGQQTVDGMDLRIAGDEDGHFAYLADHAAARAGIDEALFGVARGRLKPRVMFRAALLASPDAPECHVAVVYAGRKRPGMEPLLEGRQHPHPQMEMTAADPMSLRAVVAPCATELHGTMLRVFSARDRLDSGWELLQARVHWQQRACQFATEVNLAPEQNGSALRALHSMADWVIVLSELPVQQALELFDRNVVRLIDRKRFFDHGRERHLAVSTSHSRVVEELLAQEMDQVCGQRPPSLDELLVFVRRFAPGLAMRCVGRPQDMGPGGILGLLLTAKAGELESPGSVAIPLDEHPWLCGRGGLRADVLLVKPAGLGLELQILEAKYSKDGADEVGRKAVRQVDKSATALRAWLELTELDAYFRRRLYDVVIAHSAGSPEREILARRLVQGAPVEMCKTSDVHIWVWSGSIAAQVSVSEGGGVRTVVHSATETKKRLWDLATVPDSSPGSKGSVALL